MYRVFSDIKARPEVQDVLVGLHGDWEEALDDAGLWPAGEHVYIYTSANRSEVETWIRGLEADGAIEGWPNGKPKLAPDPNHGCKVYAVVWD